MMGPSARLKSRNSLGNSQSLRSEIDKAVKVHEHDRKVDDFVDNYHIAYHNKQSQNNANFSLDRSQSNNYSKDVNK